MSWGHRVNFLDLVGSNTHRITENGTNHNSSTTFYSSGSRPADHTDQSTELRDAKRQKMAETGEDVLATVPFNAPEGDVILVVGEKKERIQAYSVVLKTASPVFAAMLGPNFSEGKRLEESEEEPVEIWLPDDDPQAFTAVCRVLHWASKEESLLSPKLVRDIAVLVDKYDIASSFSCIGRYWFQFNLSEEPSTTAEKAEYLWTLTLAAYCFQFEDYFYKFSQRLALLGMDSYLSLAYGAPDHPLEGLRLYVAIVEMRLQASRTCRPVKGLCLSCFKTTKSGFKDPESGCKDARFHEPLVPGHAGV